MTVMHRRSAFSIQLGKKLKKTVALPPSSWFLRKKNEWLLLKKFFLEEGPLHTRSGYRAFILALWRLKRDFFSIKLGVEFSSGFQNRGNAKLFSNFLSATTQGCQIFLGSKYQNKKFMPNDHKIFQMATKIYQMVVRQTNLP
jgi:hypothetical protein